MFTRREPPPHPDSRLDPYRAGIARVYEGETLVGHLATRVQVWWMPEGRWWRRRWVGPKEYVEWLVSFDPFYEHGHGDGFDDGILWGGEPWLQDLEENRFRYQGRSWRLERFSGEEAEKQYAEYGW